MLATSFPYRLAETASLRNESTPTDPLTFLILGEQVYPLLSTHKMYAGGAILMAASLASAFPQHSKRQSPGCSTSSYTFPDNFKLAAISLHDTSSKVWLQAYDNAGTYPYQFLFGAGAPQEYATNFSYASQSHRLTTNITTRSGTTEWSSLAPTPNNDLNFTRAPLDNDGGITGVQVSCGTTSVPVVVAGDPAGVNAQNPWALCQILGWTTSLSEVIFAPTNSTSTSGCRRVALQVVPV